MTMKQVIAQLNWFLYIDLLIYWFIIIKKFVLPWSHAINKIIITKDSTFDWIVEENYNISKDFRNVQIETTERLKTDTSLSYTANVNEIL
nr:10912_t:CDS:2 [Entrophospora candida]